MTEWLFSHKYQLKKTNTMFADGIKANEHLLKIKLSHCLGNSVFQITLYLTSFYLKITSWWYGPLLM